MIGERIELWHKEEYHYPAAHGFIPIMVSYIHEDELMHPAMLVVPGGGYRLVSPSEAHLVAMEFYQAGYNVFNAYQELSITGIVAASDMTAAGLQKAAQESNVKLPGALSVVSIDGTLICDIATPALTSVTQNFVQIGIESVNCLVGKSATRLVPVTLVERESVATI